MPFCFVCNSQDFLIQLNGANYLREAALALEHKHIFGLVEDEFNDDSFVCRNCHTRIHRVS